MWCWRLLFLLVICSSCCIVLCSQFYSLNITKASIHILDDICQLCSYANTKTKQIDTLGRIWLHWTSVFISKMWIYHMLTDHNTLKSKSQPLHNNSLSYDVISPSTTHLRNILVPYLINPKPICSVPYNRTAPPLKQRA